MLARQRALQIALGEAAKNVHEQGGDNTGPRVRQYQAATSLGGTGWAWCDAFCDFCFAGGREGRSRSSTARPESS